MGVMVTRRGVNSQAFVAAPGATIVVRQERSRMLEIESLCKTYRKGLRGRNPVVANDQVSLSVEAGQVFGLLGHNGAGKTTLVNQVVGLLKPDSGRISVEGHDAIADPGLARQLASLQPQAQVPIIGLTGRQTIEIVGAIRDPSRSGVRERANRLIEALDIGEWIDRPGENVSGGVKRLVSFCMAAVSPGRVVILDEPTNDVDPVRRRLLWSQVRALADQGVAVLLVTHNVVEAERAVDRLAILDRGRVIAHGTTEQLKASVGQDLRLELVREPGADLPAIPDFAHSTTADHSRCLVRLAGERSAEAVAWAEAQQQAGLLEEFSLGPATLEDVYVELVGRADALEASPEAPAA
jgi:ABC-2 type transport system ATP-binding protein